MDHLNIKSLQGFLPACTLSTFSMLAEPWFVFLGSEWKVYNWKRKQAAFTLATITENETSLLRPNCPSSAALKVVVVTNSKAANDGNLIQWCTSNQNNDTSVSVIILLDIYITHKCLLLMTYITVWDGAVNAIHIQVALFYGGQESVYTMGCGLFLENLQRCVIYQDR